MRPIDFFGWINPYNGGVSSSPGSIMSTSGSGRKSARCSATTNGPEPGPPPPCGVEKFLSGVNVRMSKSRSRGRVIPTARSGWRRRRTHPRLYARSRIPPHVIAKAPRLGCEHQSAMVRRRILEFCQITLRAVRWKLNASNPAYWKKPGCAVRGSGSTIFCVSRRGRGDWRYDQHAHQLACAPAPAAGKLPENR